jgi:hypothetical protein
VRKSSGVFQPVESDSFASTGLGLQWQWHALPSPYWYYLNPATRETHTNGLGSLRLYSVEQTEGWKNLGDTPNLLLQKTPADKFCVTAKVCFIPNPQLAERNESCGLVLMGQDYATLKLKDTREGVILQYVECHNALKGSEEEVQDQVKLESKPLPMPYSNKYMSTTVPPVKPVEYLATDIFLRMRVAPRERKGNVPDMAATFWYSLDGKKWTQMKNPMKSGKDADFIGRPGKWIGAKFGFYCNRLNRKNDSGWMQIDWVQITE